MVSYRSFRAAGALTWISAGFAAFVWSLDNSTVKVYSDYYSRRISLIKTAAPNNIFLTA